MTLYYEDDRITLRLADGDNAPVNLLSELALLSDKSAHCVVTSPPYYGLRDYGADGQIGIENSPAAYVETMRAVFTEIQRILTDDGTLWLNLGDSYSSRADGSAGRTAGSSRPVAMPGRINTTGTAPLKNMLGIPWRVAFALQDDGWILRNDIIWSKPTAMPERVTDRFSKRHEHVFLFTKKKSYWFDIDPLRVPVATGRPQQVRARQLFEEKGLTAAHLAAARAVGMNDAGKAIVTQTGAGKNRDEIQKLADETKAALGGYYRELLYDESKGRNPGDVWTIPAQPFAAAHFATMPPTLAERCVQAGCRPGGVVLDPFSGSGTTGLAAVRHNRRYLGIDINAEYLNLSLHTRLAPWVEAEDTPPWLAA